MQLLSTIASGLALLGFVNAQSNQLQQVTAFNAGPTRAGMYVYIPTKKLTPAPIIVAIHWCTGTGPVYFQNSKYASLADTHGFIVIYPSAPSSGGCWDVASTQSLTHGQGGDSLTIINMVNYAVKNYGGDANRVYATGTSSGAMMTNVLAGAYPDVIKAGSVYSGVPDGCFYVAGSQPGDATPGWNNQCSSGQSIKTAEQWGALVRSYYPGYNGSYPKMQIFHGTADTALSYPNLGEQLKEWSNLLGVSYSRNVTNNPENGYTQMIYGNGSQLVGYSALNVGHTVPLHENMDLSWFGLA